MSKLGTVDDLVNDVVNVVGPAQLLAGNYFQHRHCAPFLWDATCTPTHRSCNQTSSKKEGPARGAGRASLIRAKRGITA